MIETIKRKRLTKEEAGELSKQIQDLIASGHEILKIAKTLGKSRQLVEYYARYRKLSTRDLQIKDK